MPRYISRSKQAVARALIIIVRKLVVYGLVRVNVRFAQALHSFASSKDKRDDWKFRCYCFELSSVPEDEVGGTLTIEHYFQ